MGTQLPLLQRGTAPNFRPMSIVAKRSPISASAEHLLPLSKSYQIYPDETSIVPPINSHDWAKTYHTIVRGDYIPKIAKNNIFHGPMSTLLNRSTWKLAWKWLSSGSFRPNFTLIGVSCCLCQMINQKYYKVLNFWGSQSHTHTSSPIRGKIYMQQWTYDVKLLSCPFSVESSRITPIAKTAQRALACQD